MTYAQATKSLWKMGAAHAVGNPLLALYAMNIETAHGGKAKTYYAHLKTQSDPHKRMLELMKDRSTAWDVLMGVTA